MQAPYKNMLLTEEKKTTNMRKFRKIIRWILIWIRLAAIHQLWTSWKKEIARKKKRPTHIVPCEIEACIRGIIFTKKPYTYADLEIINSRFSDIVVSWLTSYYDLVLTDSAPLSSYDCLVIEKYEFSFHTVSYFKELASFAIDTLDDTITFLVPLFILFERVYKWEYLSRMDSVLEAVALHMTIYYSSSGAFYHKNWDFNILWKVCSFTIVPILDATSSLLDLEEVKLLKESTSFRKHIRQVVRQPDKRPFFNSLFKIGRAPKIQPVRLNGSNILHYITGRRFFFDNYFVRQESITRRHRRRKRTVRSTAYAEKHISADCSEIELTNTRIFEPLNKIVRLCTFYNEVEDMFQDLFDVHKQMCPIELEHADALNFNRNWFVSWIPEALRAFDEYLFNDNDILVFSSRMAAAHKIRFVQKAYYAPFVIPVRFFEWLCFGERSVNKSLHRLTYEHLHSLFFADDVSIVTHKYSCDADLNRAQDLLAEYTYTVGGHSYNLGLISS